MSTDVRIELGPEGALTGVNVIGFEGEVDDGYTPALRGPVLEYSGHLARIDRIEPSTSEEFPAAVWLRMGGPAPVEDESLPGVGTCIGPFPAILDHQFVIVGMHEVRTANTLLVTEDLQADEASTSVHRFLAWLNDPVHSPVPGLAVQWLGGKAIWYCLPREGHALFKRIQWVALQEMVRSSNTQDRKRLYEASWWLSRAATEEAYVYLAVVGLEQCDPGMADTLRHSVFRKVPPGQLEVEERRARERFREHCEKWQQREADSPATAEKYAHRDNVRKLSLVRSSEH